MNEQETKKRNELIGQFLTSAKDKPVSRPRIFDLSEDYEGALHGLVYDFGHDQQTQDFVIQELDELFTTHPAKARFMTSLAISDAAVRMDWDWEKGPGCYSEKDKSRLAFEERLALVWKQMLINDPVLSHAEKLKEAFGKTSSMSSRALSTQAKEVCRYLQENPVYAAQPW